jgi:hypothetical protein
MFALWICAKSVIYISAKPVRKAAVIEFTRHLWQGDPRVNIQNQKGKAKAYQVKQVLKAIEKLEVDHGYEK